MMSLFHYLLLFTLLFSEGLLATNLQLPAGAAPLDHPATVIQRRIHKKLASIDDIKKALGYGAPGDIANTINALYSMRADAEVRALLYHVWHDNRADIAEIPWEKLQHPIVRVAIAATMNRIAAGTIPSFLQYLRGKSDHEVSVVRAQVAIALGMTGFLEDLPLLERYAEKDNDYVAESAILGLGFVYKDEAKQVLIKLREKFKGKKRAIHIEGMLREAYAWQP